MRRALRSRQPTARPPSLHPREEENRMQSDQLGVGSGQDASDVAPDLYLERERARCCVWARRRWFVGVTMCDDGGAAKRPLAALPARSGSTT
jgi:hypothetical protein